MRKARLRRERETHRLAFLTTLTDRQREVARLSAWLTSQQDQDSSTNMARMNEWVRDRLTALLASLDDTGLEFTLEKSALFPAVDDFHDPEGEPPKDPYGYY